MDPTYQGSVLTLQSLPLASQSCPRQPQRRLIQILRSCRGAQVEYFCLELSLVTLVLAQLARMYTLRSLKVPAVSLLGTCGTATEWAPPWHGLAARMISL